MVIDISKLTMRREIKKIILHHSASDFGNAEVIDGWHRERGYTCIGYHYVICNGSGGADGIIDIGRPLWFEGAHAKGHNKDSVGICLIGDFTDSIPSEAQLKSLDMLIKTLRTAIGPGLSVLFHSDVCNTTCPGITGVYVLNRFKQ